MLEFMDRTSINAVEDLTRMGLNREAEAMLVMQSDEPAMRAADEIAQMAEHCAANHATEVFGTTDAEESAAYVAARRMVIPAMEPLGSLLLEDVGVPLPAAGGDGPRCRADRRRARRGDRRRRARR